MFDLPHHAQVVQSVVRRAVEELISTGDAVEAWKGTALAVGGIYAGLDGVGCGAGGIVVEVWRTGSPALEESGGFGGMLALVGHTRGWRMSGADTSSHGLAL